jgi:hypothetical protein
MGMHLEGHLLLAAYRHGEAAVCCVFLLEISASTLQIADFTLRIAHLHCALQIALLIFNFF